MVLSPDNPFRPDAGVSPPLRAGHEEAAAHLAWRLGLIRGGKEGGTVVLFGPRGNGKTVLLHELRRTAGETVRLLSLTTRMMAGDPDVIARKFAPDPDAKGIKEFGGGIGSVRTAVKFQDRIEVTPWDALSATLMEEPVLLTVDEAHEMPADFGQELLQSAQDCVADGFPLLLVLAGTPGLPTHLGEMRASFRERCTELRIGRIETDEAVREALARPAKDTGMPIDADALESLVKESQRYPFFVQKLGFESWNAARARGGPRRITAEDAHKGIAATKEQLPRFHNKRRNEMYEHGVLAAAEAVSKVVFERGRDALLTGEELMAAVTGAATAGAQDPRKVVRRLVHLGLVWETPGLDWEPGIPSLCTFLVEREGREVVE